MEIDRSNYEIWLIDWIDGNLNSLQIDQLKLFLNENPDLREEFNDFNSMNLSSLRYFFQQQRTFKKVTFRYFPVSVRIPLCSILRE